MDGLTSFDQNRAVAVDDTKRPHAVVIGAGFGGLAAAIRLCARGYRVTVLERLDQPGGRASVFRQDGFTFDSGPTIITLPHLFEELWSLCGRRMADDVDLRALSPFYRIRFDDGDVFTYSGDPEAMRAEVARVSPGDLPGYERLLRSSEIRYRIGFEDMGTRPFNTLKSLISSVPDIVRLSGYRSLYSVVSSYVRHDKLRTVLSYHTLLIGGNPFAASSIYGLIAALERRWGIHFAMGGMGAMVRGMTDLLRDQGGHLRLNAEVRRILVVGGRAVGVRLADGEEIPADIVVSNADSAWTYRDLLADVPRRRWTDRKLQRARFSMGLFVWYFGTNRRYPDVTPHTMVLGPRFRALLTDIFERKILAEDFSLYLYRPTAMDPTLAPDGCDSFYVLSPVPNLAGGPPDWSAVTERYRAAIERRLAETVLPGLGDAVVTSRIMTPVDFRHRYLSPLGAGFSFEPVLTQSAWFRPHNISEEVERLYLVGAGTHPGAGVPGVLTSARILDQLVPHASVLA